MTAIPRRRTPYLDVYHYDYDEETSGQAAGPSHLSAATSRPKRYSAISSKSALTADTPSTPPRTPSPVGYRHLEVPVTALPGVKMDEEGAKERESRSLRRARSAERTRTWAEEVERQRMKVERKAGRAERASEHRWVNDDASEIWTASSEAIHAIVDELNPESSHLSHLPSADRVIANISRKTIKLSSSPSESDASGEAYFGSQRHKAAMKRATAKKTDKKAEEKRPEARRTSKDRAAKTADPQPVQVVFPGPALSDRRSRSRKEQSHTTSVEAQQATSAARPATRTRSSTSPQSVVAPLPAPPTPPITATKPKVALLSIDDIVRKHSSAVNGALNAVTEKARKDLGTAPTSSPAISPVPTLPSPGPVPPPRGSSRSIRSARSPPPRMSSLPVSPAHSPPARNSSLPVQPLLSCRQTYSASTDARLSINPDQRTRPRASTLFPSSDEELSNDDVMNDILAGQALLDRLETGSIASSRKRLESRAHSSTPPPDRYSSPTPSSTRSKRQSLPAQRKEEEDHVMAVYLRSSRLNRIIQLPRAYPERPLQVSLADIGSPTGTPVLIFLGIGCVRHLIALFDDLAKALNIRLICVDRWGFGKTTNVSQDKRAPMDWAGVVERVLDEIKVDDVRIIAHSAGAPYAAATALRLGDRVKGKIQFLAPWISADIDGGYKWLKWVPNGVIKSAFAAEWKLQSYRLGKPPPLNHKPISHVAENADLPSRPASARINSDQTVRNSPTPTGSPYLSRTPSLAKRASQILIGRSDNPASSAVTLATPQNVSSLRKVRSNAPVRSHSDQSVPSKASLGTGVQTPSGSASSGLSSTYLKTPGMVDQRDLEVAELEDERFVADLGMALPSPSLSSIAEKPPTDASLLHALEQASHAECEPGTTDDLLTIILNRPPRPWGFSYADLTQPATIWWGSEDERISEKSVRWMERVIVGGAELKVVQGADHNLMRSVPVMCEIFQEIADEARREA